MTARWPVRPHLRPKPLHFQATNWEGCCELAAVRRVAPEDLWPTLNHIIVHVRDPLAPSEWIIADQPLDWADRLPTAGEA
jgi:hypothetical protein